MCQELGATDIFGRGNDGGNFNVGTEKVLVVGTKQVQVARLGVVAFYSFFQFNVGETCYIEGVIEELS